MALLSLGSAEGQVGAKPSAAVGARAEAGSRPVVDGSVEAFLREFERVSETNDADAKAALYADEVDRYFLRTHVTRAFVRADVLDWLSRGRLITQFHFTVLSASGMGDERTLLVRKEAAWIAGDQEKRLVTRSQLVLRRGAGRGWKVVGERDLKG